MAGRLRLISKDISCTSLRLYTESLQKLSYKVPKYLVPTKVLNQVVVIISFDSPYLLTR